MTADLSGLCKKGSFALLDPLLLTEISDRRTRVRLCFDGFALHCGRTGGSLEASSCGHWGWREEAGLPVPASAQVDMVTSGTSPSVS